MLSAYTGGQIREAEQPLLSGGAADALMLRAAYGLYAESAKLLHRRRGGCYGRTAVILAGSGNNGGDALYAGSRLLRRGVRTTAVLASGRAHARALQAFVDRGGRVWNLDAHNANFLAAFCAGTDLVIDGILGTGAHGGLREPAAQLVRSLARFPARRTGSPVEASRPASGWEGIEEEPRRPVVVACDLPSGVDADTGAAHHPVLAADATVTFGAAKAGLLVGPGSALAGALTVVDLGLAPHLPKPALRRLGLEDAAALYRPPRREDHKYSRGVLGIAAGSAQYPGAAVLATGAALATGVGMVRYLGPAHVSTIINTVHPEAVCSPAQVPQVHVQAWLVGPGAGEDTDQRQRAHDAIASGQPTVVDASALPLVSECVDAGVELGPHVILTPHAGELRALLAARSVDVTREAVEQSPVEHARRAAELTGATVLLKGSVTVAAAPSGELFSAVRATPWLATAGTGDTLAGILGALAATLAEDDRAAARLGLPQHLKWAAVAAAAAVVHGAAGQRAARDGPVVTAELPVHIGAVISALVGPYGTGGYLEPGANR
jgi:hydroxyethylthiazole kinase-like uncharacterized protein yjeF